METGTAKLAKEYRRQRALGVPATHAIHAARTLVEWEGLGGHTKQVDDDYEEPDATVRLHILPDDDWEHAAECGCPDTRCKERNTERANRDGVWGIVGEYRIRGEWEQGDSVWGFIGSDWEDSGYDTDVMSGTIRALNAAIGAF